MPAARRGRPVLPRVVRAWYLATPAFALADVLLGANLRATFLEHTPVLKWAYYGVAAAAGVAAWQWPEWTAWIGLGESGLNIALLVLSVGIAYIGAAAMEQVSPFTPEAVLNLVLSATMLVVSYLAGYAHLTERRPGR